MNMRNEIPNTNKVASNISIYPNPPAYYTKFIDGNDKMNPPRMDYINKIESFGSFGFEYKINDYNFYSIELDYIMKIHDRQYIEQKRIPNVEIFNKSIEEIRNTISKMTIEEQIGMIKAEVQFLNFIYTDLTKKLNFNIKECEVNNKLMKFSLQKIYYVISIIKQKQVFVETLKFFKNEIYQINTIEKNIDENLDKCYSTLSEKLNRIKGDMNALLENN